MTLPSTLCEPFPFILHKKPPKEKKPSNKYLDKKLAAVSCTSALMKKRVDLLEWIRKNNSDYLAEKSMDREDYFASGFLQPEIITAIFTILETIQDSERYYIFYLLDNIHELPLLENQGATKKQ